MDLSGWRWKNLTEARMPESVIENGIPEIVDRAAFEAKVDTLRLREKAHTREGDAIAAERRRLPMVPVDGSTPLIGERGSMTLLDAFEGRASHRRGPSKAAESRARYPKRTRRE